MAQHQGPHRRAACKIYVHGKDITDKLNPYLISVQVIDTWEGDHDQCNIELDDRNAELQIPPDDAKLEVYLGWAGEGPRLPDLGRSSAVGGQGPMPQQVPQGGLTGELPWGAQFGIVFSGIVTEVESGFGRRGGGRRMWITATSGNVKGPAKEMQRGNWGEGKEDDSEEEDGGGEKSPTGGGGGGGGGGKIPLKDVMTDMFKKAGMTVKLSPEMEKIKRDYWHANDSPMNFASRMARENGGRFKIANNIAMMVGATEGTNVDGQKMPNVDAVWGVNLIGWRIKPYIGRPQWGATQSRFFNLGKGAWEDIKGASIGGGTPFGGTDAIAHAINSVVDKNVGGQVNGGAEGDSKSRRAAGWCLINGDPNAKAGGQLTISGARPGVDGPYYISEAEHNYTRGVGYTTRMNVMNSNPPQSGFGWKRTAPKEEPPADFAQRFPTNA